MERSTLDPKQYEQMCVVNNSDFQTQVIFDFICVMKSTFANR
jgi:hypothetical protein